MTGQLFVDPMVDVVMLRDCEETVAARSMPVAENPIMGSGRSSGRSVVSIGLETL